MSETGALPKEFVEQQRGTPMTNSNVHLHLGIDATGLHRVFTTAGSLFLYQ